MNAPAPAAPAPTNGAASKTTAPAAPSPVADTASGPQTPSQGTVRGADGKFQSANPTPKPEAVDDDPEIDFGGMKLKRSHAMREIQRARSASKLLSEAQREKAEAAKLNSEREERRKKAREAGDIGSYLSELGLEGEREKELLSKYLYSKHLEPQGLTEEQKALRDAQAKLKSYEDEKKTAESKQQEAKKKADIDAAANALESEVLEAARAGRIPNSPRALRRIMEKTMQLDSVGSQLPLEHIAAAVRDEVGQDVGDFLSASELSERRELWGDELFKAEEKKWRAHFMAKIPSAPGVVAARTPPQKAQNPNERPKYLTLSQFAELSARRK